MSVNWVPSKPPPAPWSRLSEVGRARPARVDVSPGTLEGLVNRVRVEYLEMPGLSLTPEQARCLWGVDDELCLQLLRQLVEEGFLARTAWGRFVRADGG